MTLSFPAVIKSLEISEAGMLARLDISPPDVSLLADLIDQEVQIAIALPLPDKELPFEPDEPDPPPKRPRRSRPA